MSATLLVVFGLLGLVVGGELLVRGAVSAAKSFGISPMVIGLTLVGFGTSTPELVTSLQAALSVGVTMRLGLFTSDSHPASKRLLRSPFRPV